LARELALLADDEPLSQEFLREVLEGLGLKIIAVDDGEQALAALKQHPIDLVFTDLQMPGADGVEVLTGSKLREPDRPVVLITAHGTMGVAVEAMRKGADDILEKPVSPEDLELALVRVRDRRRLLQENRYFRAESIGDDLQVYSRIMSDLVELVVRVAPSKATVLISGESGTGKERVAALVHRRSDRVEGPFVKVNCAAIPDSLMESEIFGHEAGAFTGASKRREGRFELASGGTLLLDEVAEMSPMLQAKLLRVLQEGEFCRVGGSRTVQVDVRVVAATNRDLAKAVADGDFREDLYYRLNVVPVHIPPLRERKEEIMPLACHFLTKGVEFSADAEALLTSHRWPGNVRELQNLVQRACLLCRGGVIDAQLLRGWLVQGAMATTTVTGGSIAAGSTATDINTTDAVSSLVGRALREVGDELILKTLERYKGNRTKAAEVLEIGVRTLFNRLKDLHAKA
jgi:DNA-binding NtrC family response regulator